MPKGAAFKVRQERWAVGGAQYVLACHDGGGGTLTPLSLVRQCQEMMSAVLPAGGQSVKRNGHHSVGPYAPDAMLSKSAGGQ